MSGMARGQPGRGGEVAEWLRCAGAGAKNRILLILRDFVENA